MKPATIRTMSLLNKMNEWIEHYRETSKEFPDAIPEAYVQGMERMKEKIISFYGIREE